MMNIPNCVSRPMTREEIAQLKMRCPKCERRFPIDMWLCPWCHVNLIKREENYCPKCDQHVESDEYIPTKEGIWLCPFCREAI
jgi:hypothetical protein